MRLTHTANLARPRAEEIVTDSRVDGVPTLVLANKQDCEGAMAVEDIKQMFNKLIVGKMNVSEGGVLPISALRGCVSTCSAAFLAINCADRPLPTGTASEKQSTGSSCGYTSEPCQRRGLLDREKADSQPAQLAAIIAV